MTCMGAGFHVERRALCLYPVVASVLSQACDSRRERDLWLHPVRELSETALVVFGLSRRGG